MTARTNSQLGIRKLTLLVFGTITAVLVWVGYNVLPFFYYFYELKNQFESVIRVASEEPDGEIRRRLLYHIKKMKIPCNDEDLKIEREDETMTVSLQYKEIFFVTWKGKDYDIHTFHFDATVKKRFK